MIADVYKRQVLICDREPRGSRPVVRRACPAASHSRSRCVVALCCSDPRRFESSGAHRPASTGSGAGYNNHGQLIPNPTRMARHRHFHGAGNSNWRGTCKLGLHWSKCESSSRDGAMMHAWLAVLKWLPSHMLLAQPPPASSSSMSQGELPKDVFPMMLFPVE